MAKKREIDNAGLLKMVKDGVNQSEIMDHFGFKTSIQLKVAYANALMESGEAPEIKGRGRTGKPRPVKTEVRVNARGSLILPKALVESFGIPAGEKFEVTKKGSTLQLKKV